MHGPAPLAATGINAGVLRTVLVWMPIALAVFAVSFRAACTLYNKMSRPEKQVPKVSFGRALLISLISGVISLVIQLPVYLAISALGEGVGFPPQVIRLMSGAINLPLGQVIPAAIIMRLLPTTFGRGVMLSILQTLIGMVLALSVGMLIGVIIVLVMLTTRGLR